MLCIPFDTDPYSGRRITKISNWTGHSKQQSTNHGTVVALLVAERARLPTQQTNHSVELYLFSSR
jgi:hypothetical protein